MRSRGFILAHPCDWLGDRRTDPAGLKSCATTALL
jgi:hypothetical protein